MKLMKTIDLENGLKLELYDNSRKIAGDRWRVAFVARIKLLLGDLNFNRNGGFISQDQMLKSLGARLCFEQKRERNFIDEKEKDAVLRDLVDSFLSNSQSYLSHPNFPKRYVLKEYKKYMERQSWYPDEKLKPSCSNRNE